MVCTRKYGQRGGVGIQVGVLVSVKLEPQYPDASLAVQTFLWNSDHVHVLIPLEAIGNAVSFDGSFVSLKFEQLMASVQTKLGGDGGGDGTVPQAALEQHQLKLVLLVLVINSTGYNMCNICDMCDICDICDICDTCNMTDMVPGLAYVRYKQHRRYIWFILSYDICAVLTI
ncbi:hypothetical protein K439DRAFT_1615306 [Ramaria rubella]|nr:hypothetical protein K439DRAFT_1615306 [Ramaria rubella]